MKIKQSLNGTWSFRQATQTEWMSCNVPASNYTQLLALGKIADPFVGMNEPDVRWVGETDWVYTRSFAVDKKLYASDSIRLECKMLDAICTVMVNSKEVASCKNAHISYSFEIKDFLTVGENDIEITFFAPIHHIEKLQKLDPAPNASMGVSGVPHIRKAQSHFGWDWGPILPPSGIMKDIDIVGYTAAKIESIEVEQHHSKSTTVNLDIRVNTQALSDKSFTYDLELLCPDKQVIKLSNSSGVFEVSLLNPVLWYPNDISPLDEQPLYKIKATLRGGDDTFDQKSQTLGLRTIALDRSVDKYGKNFCFIVNGTPIFAKGANYIPSDSFIDRFDQTRLQTMMQNLRDSNCNMIRVWGGGYYESDEFYELCDKYGILVWQDFAFACAPYPFYNEEFLESVKTEIVQNVCRIRHHASLALWCGNNEIEMMTIGWALSKKFVKYTEIFFHQILPQLVKQYDNVTPFVVGSPSSSEGFMKKVNSDKDGDTHLWHVWHGLQPLTYYRKRFTRFCSEFGLESLPDIKTIQYFAKEEDYDLASPVFMAHQKCLSGNNKMLWYMSTRFRLPKEFSDIVYLSQLIQSECVKDATLHWRRNRGQCNGSLYWQLNDCWPVSSWSSIDYFGRYKALQYESKKFNEAITLSLCDNKKRVAFYAHNDTMLSFEGKICYTLETFDGDILTSGEYSLLAEPCSCQKIFSTNFAPYLRRTKNCVLVADLFDEEDELVARQTLLFAPEKDLTLPRCDFEKSVEVIEDTAYITVSTKKYARFVWIGLDFGTTPLSDNCFDILAGEEVTVSVPAEGKTASQILAGLDIKCINNVVARGTKASDSWTRLKISLIPINIANWIYYHTV